MKKMWVLLLTAMMLLSVALADETILLSDEGSEATLESVLIDGQTVTITEEGTYLVSGQLTNGMLLVDVPEEAKVTLLLNGVTITNDTDAALKVKKADKVILEMQEGTVNTLQSGEETVLDASLKAEEASGGALHSKEDLTIRGSGELVVLGYINNGIHCTGDVKVKEGVLTIKAINHGLKGKKSVTISGGKVVIESGKDGITSDESEKEGKGFVAIEDGELIITSAGDGVSAETNLTVSGGTVSIVSGGGSALAQKSNSNDWWNFGTSTEEEDSVSSKGLKAGKSLTISGGKITIDACDDALHSNDEMLISGGECLLSSGDDGVHADKYLTVEDGIVTVLTSYEGLEANQVTISGGEIDITASDDGINANGGSDGFANFGGGFGGSFGGSFGGRGDSQNQPENMPENMPGNMPENPPENMPENMPDGMPENLPENGMNMQEEENQETAEEEEITPLLLITGGHVIINADGDGLDSNGDLRVEGGEVIVHGPSNSGNGAIDIGSENGGVGFISGGTVLALGASGMAENFGDTSTQCAFLVTMKTFTGQQEITITDSQGTLLYTGQTVKSGNSVVFSSPALVIGETYTVTVGSQSTTITQSSTITGEGFGGFGGGRRGW